MSYAGGQEGFRDAQGTQQDAQVQEQHLVDRLLQLHANPSATAEKQRWYSDAYSFLKAHGGQHWWCRHGDVTSGLAEVLRYHDDQQLVQRIWRQLAEQLAACTDCVNAHHAGQEFFSEQFSADSAAPLVAAMHWLDCARVAAALSGVQIPADAQELPAEVVTSLFEALTYDSLLEDAEVADALAGTLCTLSARFDLALAEPGAARYGGVYRLLAHPSPEARRLVASMVRTWGPFADGSEVEVVLPTLQHWVQLLTGEQPTSNSDAASGGSGTTRPRFQPPLVAVWRALHGLLPLLQPEAAVAALAQLPHFVDAVLGGIGSCTGSGRSQLAPQTQQESDLCCWFAISCWSHLLAAVGPDIFYHTAASPAAAVQQLAAAAAASGSERLHKAAAEAVAATLLHACGPGGSYEEAVLALRLGLLFLVHDLPTAAAAAATTATGGQLPPSQHQQARPRVSQLAAAVAEAAAYSTLLQLLQQQPRDSSSPGAAAVFACAHFWLPTLCSSLQQRTSSSAGDCDGQPPPTAQQQEQQHELRSPVLYASADRLALQLAAALFAGEVAALLAAAGLQASDASNGLLGGEDAAMAAVAAAAGHARGNWQCLPALWEALVHSCDGASISSSSSSQDCSSLLLAAASSLAAAKKAGPAGKAGAAAPLAAAPPQHSAGFSAPGLSSSLARDVEAAQRLPPTAALRRRWLDADASTPSPAAISVGRGASFLSEQLQQAAAVHLALLTQHMRGGGSSSGYAGASVSAAGPVQGRHWAAVPKHWQQPLVLGVALLLVAPNALLKAAAEDFCMAATRQGSPAAAASVLAQLHPAAAPTLQPLLAQHHSQKAQRLPQAGGRPATAGGSSGNPFLRGRQQQEQQQQAQGPGGQRLISSFSSHKPVAEPGRHLPPSAPGVRQQQQQQQQGQEQRQRQQQGQEQWQRQRQQEPWQPALRQAAENAASTDFIDLTDSPPRQAPAAVAAAAGTNSFARSADQQQIKQLQQQKQQQQEAEIEVPWFLKWPSKQQAQQVHQDRKGRQEAVPHQQAQQAQQTQHAQQAQQARQSSSAVEVDDIDALWPSQWPSKAPSSGQAGAQPQRRHHQAAPAAAAAPPPSARHQSQQQQQLWGEERGGATSLLPPQRGVEMAPQRKQQLQQQQQQQQQRPQAQSTDVDVESLWPSKWPARKPAGSSLPNSSAARAGQVAGKVKGAAEAARQPRPGSSREGSPEPWARGRSVRGSDGDGLQRQRASSRGGRGSRDSSPEPYGQRQQQSRSTRATEGAGRPAASSGAAFRIPKKQPPPTASGAPAPVERCGSGDAGSRPASRSSSLERPPATSAVAAAGLKHAQSGSRVPAAAAAAAVAEPRLPAARPPQPPLPAQQQHPAAAGGAQRSEADSLNLLEEDDSLFANLGPLLATSRQLPRPPLGRQQAQQAQAAVPATAAPPVVRRIVRLAAPPPAAGGGRRGGRGAPDPNAAVPLWQQRRAALGAHRQQQEAQASLLSMDALFQQLLGWEPAKLLSSAGDGSGGSGRQGLQGLKVPVRFDNLQQYTQVFSQLLLEELRAHLQQATEENPAAASICSISISSGSGGSSSSGGGRDNRRGTSGGDDRGSDRGGGWAAIAADLADAGALPLRLLEVQRQSELHLLRFEPAVPGAAAGGGTVGEGQQSGQQQQQPGQRAESAADFSRSCGIRADDLVLLVSKPVMGAAAAGLPPAAITLAAVESVHQQQQSERRQQQGIQGRQRQVMLTLRVSLRSSNSTNNNGRDHGGNAGRLQVLQQQLAPSTAWQAVRLMSLTPHLRQLAALVAAQKLPPLLLAELLDPSPAAPARQGSGGHHSRMNNSSSACSSSTRVDLGLAAVRPALPPPLLDHLQRQYNSSQQAAIAAAAAGYAPSASAATSAASQQAGAAVAGGQASCAAIGGNTQQQVVLVQGPPGTGKTAAILGMLSAFLATNTPKGGGARPSGSTAGDGSKQQAAQAARAARVAAVVNPTVRVLLCAQSNAAVDELCSRLASRGVVGRDGRRRQVSLVRFGPLEAIGPDAAVHHIDAAAAAVEAVDTGLGESAGQASQLAGRLQSLRQQLRQLQQQIDACDDAVEESRKRKREQAHGGRSREVERGKHSQRRVGSSSRSRHGSKERGKRADSAGSPGSSMDTGSGSSSEGESDSDSETGGGNCAAGADVAAAVPSSQEVRQQLGPLLQRKQQLKKEAAAAAAALKASSAAAAARRKELRAAVVAQTEVVAATLSSAGGELLQLMPRAAGTAAGGGAPIAASSAATAPLLGFDAIICDEAAQALEPSCLIALQLLAPGGRLVLVGDPQQLPATVVSRAAAAAALAQSLFERLMRAGYPLCMLRQQYRMHPAISAWPATFFYQGQLQDAPSVASHGGGAGGGGGSGGRCAPWHERRCFPPLAFWDCREGRERSGGGGSSVSNAEEAEVAFALYAGLVAQYRRDVGDVAVLTPYKAQLAQLRRTFQQRGGMAAAEAVQFATVDGFQGREADVVLFSCVRAHTGHGASGGVGFLSDVRRMNVALTRARRSLWVIGHSRTLAACQPWQELMEHCHQQQCMFTAAPPYERMLHSSGSRRS